MADISPPEAGSLVQVLEELKSDRTLMGQGFGDVWRSRVDEWLAAIYESATSGGDLGARAALVAIGGYGRGDLAPGSDLDLLLLHDMKEPPGELANALWYPIWDEGMKLGHSVRTIKEAIELGEQDLDTATALLSARLIAGDESLVEELQKSTSVLWSKKAKRLLSTLRDNVIARQSQAGEVAFLLEPDLKDGRGGLRDIHALRWAQAARLVLDEDEQALLEQAETVLFSARVELHRVTGRATERLTLQDQDGVGSALGISADELMAQIARAARSVAWVADEAWARVDSMLSSSVSLLGWRSRSHAPGIVVKGGQVLFESNVDPASRPDLILEVATIAAQKRARISRDVLKRLGERSPQLPEVWSDTTRNSFVELLLSGHDAIAPIETLDHAGLWERYLPEWSVVRSRPQRNAYHRFTVDRHLLETAANVSAFADRVQRSDLLVLGALLHDIGKGRPGDHTDVGVELIAQIGPRMGLSTEDTSVISDMCRNHLLLADVATRRDISDEQTVVSTAKAVGDPQRLQLLHALTEADSLATGPAAWGAWKAQLVDELVHRVDHYLQGGSPAAIKGNEFPTAHHMELVEKGAVTIETTDDVLTVVAPDQAGLFARVAGVLAIGGLEVHSADLAVVDSMAVEVFQVSTRFGSSIPWEKVQRLLQAALDGRLAIDARIAERAKTYVGKAAPAELTPPVVRFDDEASATATVVEVHAFDRIGLLYRVARSFTELGLDVRTAKIQTVGSRVVDSFYVTNSNGTLVSDKALRDELTRSLLHAVSPL